MTRKILFGRLALAGCTLIAATQIGRAQMTMSESATAPVPGPYDISQLQFQTAGNVQPSGGFPVGFNYYWDASTTSPGKPGSTFTTGSNPGGYVLNSVTVLTIPVGAFVAQINVFVEGARHTVTYHRHCQLSQVAHRAWHHRTTAFCAGQSQ